MAAKFPPFVAYNDSYPRVMRFTVKSTGAWTKPMALVVYDTSVDTIDECGADPANILGFATAPAAVALASSGKLLYADAKMPVFVLKPGSIIGMSGVADPTEADVLSTFGIALDSTTKFWQVDTTDAVNTRVVVVQVDVLNHIWYVKFLAANLQADAIAS